MIRKFGEKKYTKLENNVANNNQDQEPKII